MDTPQTTSLAVLADTASATSPLAVNRISGITDPTTHISLLCVMAQEAHVTVSDGTVFQGVFGGTESNFGEVHIILRYARVIVGDVSLIDTAAERRGNVATRLCIPVSTLVRMDAGPISSCTCAQRTHSVDPLNRADGPRQESHQLATDREIAAQATHERYRELQEFNDFVDIKGNCSMDSETIGDLNLASPGEKWDQFQANLSQFGVETSFDESEYTTTIDHSSADFLEREREAVRLATEIEKKSSSNSHLQEERNQRLPSQGDEEDRYSAVLLPDGKSEALNTASTLKKQSIAKSYKASAESGESFSKPEAAPTKMNAPKTVEKRCVSPATSWSGPAKPVSGKVVPGTPRAVTMKPGSSVHTAGRRQKTKSSNAPAPLKAHAQRKMSYAVAAGAKRTEQAPSPTTDVPAAVLDAPSPPLSPLSPANPTIDTRRQPALPSAPRTSSNRIETRQSTYVSNADRCPPSHPRSSRTQARNSAVHPKNQYTGAVDVSTAGTGSHTFGKAEKKKKRRSSSRNKPTADNPDCGTGVSRRTSGSASGPCTAGKSGSRLSHGRKVVSQKAPVPEVKVDAAAASPQIAQEVPKAQVAGTEAKPSDKASTTNEIQHSYKPNGGPSAQLGDKKTADSLSGMSLSSKSEERQQEAETTSAPIALSAAEATEAPRQESTMTNRRKSNMPRESTKMQAKQEVTNADQPADDALNTSGKQRSCKSKVETSAHQSESITKTYSNGVSPQIESHGQQQSTGSSPARNGMSGMEDTQLPRHGSTTANRRKSKTVRESPKMPVKEEATKVDESADFVLNTNGKQRSCTPKFETSTNQSEKKTKRNSNGMSSSTDADKLRQEGKISPVQTALSALEGTDELQQGSAAASQMKSKTARKLPKVQVAVQEEAANAHKSTEAVLNRNGTPRSYKPKGETSRQLSDHENEGNSNGLSLLTKSDGQHLAADTSLAPAGLSPAEDTQAAKCGPTTANRMKCKIKLNPDAAAWVPSPGVIPVDTANAHADRVTSMEQAYPQTLVNFAMASSGILEQQQASGMVYTRAPTFASYPSYGHLVSYPVMMPGAVRQYAHVPGYAYVPRDTGIVPVGAQQSPTSAAVRGATCGMAVGNTSSAEWQFFNGQQYLPMQSSMHQPGMAPAYLSNGGQEIATAASDGVLQHYRMIGGRRSGGHGRGRQQRGHHQSQSQVHGADSGYSANSSLRNDGRKQHGQYGKQRHWYPVVRGDSEKLEGKGLGATGAVRDHISGDAEQEGVDTTNTQEQ